MSWAGGEEVEGNYPDAGRGYLALELNFASFGDSESVRWAYLRRRRMQRCAKLERARAAAADHSWHLALINSADYAADGLAEGVCDYGRERLPGGPYPADCSRASGWPTS